MSDQWADHDCLFDEVILEEVEEGDENLRAGDRILVPCRTCGETPLDHLESVEADHRLLSEALLAAQPAAFLYHWSPVARRKQIERYGLRPRMRNSTHVTSKAPMICFADSPSWAWALSGGMPWTPAGEWDLWQTSVDRLVEPLVLASEDRASGIHEVRTEHRVYKRDLWHVGSRLALR